MVTIEPDLSMGEDRCFKLPFLASQVLSVEEAKCIFEQFVTNPGDYQNKFEILNYALRFLKVPERLNPTLTGYFSKMMFTLMKAREKDVIAFFNAFPENLDLFLSHAESDCILKFFVHLIDKLEEEVSYRYWAKMIDRLGNSGISVKYLGWNLTEHENLEVIRNSKVLPLHLEIFDIIGKNLSKEQH